MNPKKPRPPCKNCKKECKRPASIYCSSKCYMDYKYNKYIDDWKIGKADGLRGIKLKTLSRHVIRYMREAYDKCIMCGWNKINPITKSVPLEIDHIDGNHLNNHISNLRVLCPNCHSLTPTFRALNMENGRQWRK